MGLHEKQISNGNFLGIKHGGLCLESKEPLEGYGEVTVDNPSKIDADGKPVQVTKYIKKFSALDGMVSRLEWYDRTDGGVRYVGLKMHIKDGGDHFQVDLPFGKKHFDYFTKVMENIDYSQPVELNAWRDKKDPRQTAFLIKQDGHIIQWKYTRDNMGECPPAVQDVMGNWDFRDQRTWLYKKLREEIIPHVEALNVFDEPQPEYTGGDAEDDGYSEEEKSAADEAYSVRIAEAQKAVGQSASTFVRPVNDDDIPF